MPVLRNGKHERMAQELANGSSATKAYATAGFSPNSGAASRMQRQPHIVQRVAELLSNRADVIERAAVKAVDEQSLTKAWVIEKLVENVERSLQAKPVLDATGKPTGEFRYDGSVANRALELLGKELGMFVDRKEVRVGVLDDLNVDERDKLRDAVRTELARRLAGIGPAGQPEADRAVSALH